jgi:DNA-binding NarL/FixJ family response regulator
MDPHGGGTVVRAVIPSRGGPSVRIVLADDAILLERRSPRARPRGSRSSAKAADMDGLLREVDRTLPDLVVVDVRMPPSHTTEGLEAAREIRRRHRGMPILVLSQYIETRYAVELVREDPGGIGYLLKDRVARLDDLADAVRRVAAGDTVIDPEVVARLLGRPRRHTPLDELTPREREILGLMAEGRSNQGIADRLVLELRTVEGHVGQIFSKLGPEPSGDDHRRVLAVLTALRSPEPE